MKLLNDGDADAYVFVTHMPTTVGKGRLMNDLFEVVNADGEEAGYLGQIVDVARNKADYTRIPAGKALTLTVNIPINYETRPGVSRISLKPIKFESQPLDGNGTTSWAKSDPSPTLEVWFTHATPPYETFTALLTGPGVHPSAAVECPITFSPQGLIDAGKALEEAAWVTVRNNTTIDGQGRITYHPDERWGKWFGSRTEVPPEATLSSGNARATARVMSIHYGLSTQLGLGKPPIIRCDECDGYGPDTRAHIEHPGILSIALGDYSKVSVVLCPSFFALKPVGKPVSQASILLHEMSHFPIMTALGVLQGTGDDGETTAEALALAKSNPYAAANAANNHEFWFNNP
ncbi:M35 family metallo-endopeptidase [Luteibacter yeojuensis]|uniref:M35 family metallo-endopeptidase n=1 Tax=Luteibacter yeojuensis TaxID=345309 RepID=UPI0018DD251C|nr:M35 family metallo-endopeptidase [Luteibacter yeojuensis]